MYGIFAPSTVAVSGDNVGAAAASASGSLNVAQVFATGKAAEVVAKRNLMGSIGDVAGSAVKPASSGLVFNVVVKSGSTVTGGLTASIAPGFNINVYNVADLVTAGTYTTNPNDTAIKIAQGLADKINAVAVYKLLGISAKATNAEVVLTIPSNLSFIGNALPWQGCSSNGNAFTVINPNNPQTQDTKNTGEKCSKSSSSAGASGAWYSRPEDAAHPGRCPGPRQEASPPGPPPSAIGPWNPIKSLGCRGLRPLPGPGQSPGGARGGASLGQVPLSESWYNFLFQLWFRPSTLVSSRCAFRLHPRQWAFSPAMPPATTSNALQRRPMPPPWRPAGAVAPDSRSCPSPGAAARPAPPRCAAP